MEHIFPLISPRCRISIPARAERCRKCLHPNDDDNLLLQHPATNKSTFTRMDCHGHIHPFRRITGSSKPEGRVSLDGVHSIFYFGLPCQSEAIRVLEECRGGTSTLNIQSIRRFGYFGSGKLRYTKITAAAVMLFMKLLVLCLSISAPE